MSATIILTNARLVLDDEVVDGTVMLHNGRIDDVATGKTQTPGAEDLDGDYLIPGLVELHTDHLEAHAFPRPGVSWPIMPALIAHDAAIASAGITTVFDAVAIGHDAGKDYRQDLCDIVIAALEAASDADLLRAEHSLHLRCEIAMPGVIEVFDRNAVNPRVRLVSIMDHTPGQRQFVDLDKYREYHRGKYGISATAMERQIEERAELQHRYASAHRRHISAWCRHSATALASHDDATEAHVAEAAAEGVTIAEFPTTWQAAAAAHGFGMSTVLGAPNLVRGGSHSGNVAAAELATAGLLDAFSSDYVPASLLDAAWRLRGLGYALPSAIATITRNPAQMLALTDRGRLLQGLRADVVRVRDAAHGPVVRRVWREGRAVA